MGDVGFVLLSHQLPCPARLHCKNHKVSEEFSFEDLRKLCSGEVIPLMIISVSNQLHICTINAGIVLEPCNRLIGLVNLEKEKVRAHEDT